MSELTINDFFPDWLYGKGIFHFLDTLDVPWKSDISSLSLDAEYHGNVSGGKYISPLLTHLSLSDSDRQRVANIIYDINSFRWKRIYDTQSLVYKPIENYDMTEEMTNDNTIIEYGKTNTRTDALKTANSGSDNVEYGRKDTRTDNLQSKDSGTELIHHDVDAKNDFDNYRETSENGVQGFNSSSYNDSDRTVLTKDGIINDIQHNDDNTTFGKIVDNTGTQTMQASGKDTMTYGLNQDFSGTQTYEDTGQDTHKHSYTLTRHGNIGVTTSQQMLESERNLWLWNFIRQVVIPDIDEVLSLEIY